MTPDHKRVVELQKALTTMASNNTGVSGQTPLGTPTPQRESRIRFTAEALSEEYRADRSGSGFKIGTLMLQFIRYELRSGLKEYPPELDPQSISGLEGTRSSKLLLTTIQGQRHTETYSKKVQDAGYTKK
ncbi:hypothetical protein H5410_035618 [Solanum commersonii]|uniref:Uncharacterized protein n=1 Tax=Solanum commersonii TaxID=4109 RepID=A0A9J5Y352_SOLCO|nr:hypothetical protein H5410_035618 [Solanum commersonii]